VKKNHVGIGIVMGAALGVVFGAALGNVGLGIPIGAGIGLLLGMIFRATSRKRKGTIA
jgi:H+/Cl- antiporter ClcA